MSEVQNPVEQQPAAVEATPVVEPVAETKAVETPAAATTTEASNDVVAPVAATEETKAVAPKHEFTGEGTLGYKAPGGSFMK
jgi:hypothetical protein